MMKFQKLTPFIDKDSIKDHVYHEAFNFVFANDEIKNIAISGGYGAGKSSIFETYMHHWKSKEKIIHISLAHFEQLENCGKGTKSQDEASLEAKIINQLVHQIKPIKIKKTNFIARIKNRFWLQILKSTGISIAILLTIFLVFVEYLKPILRNISNKSLKSIFSFFITSEGLLLLSAILFLIVFLFILDILQQSKGNNILKKLSINNITIDLLDEQEDSFFDRYLSEIRYLFDNSDSTIVAIEDIDRYFSSSIFEKIRELNTVINYDKEKPIRFFYIIKDDLFTSKDRTKFFDFIIPIVPIIDASNSYSQLRLLLLEGSEGIAIDNRFLRGLSIYINDMRVLKNIVNEFTIYRAELQEEELDPNKLLALITYKNLFPKDFNDLQIGTGYLFSLIQSRSKFAEIVIKNDREKLEKLDQEIEALNREHLQNLDELGALYLKPTSGIESVNNKNLNNFDSQLSVYLEIKNNPAKVIAGPSRSVQNLSSNLSNLQNNVNYSERKKKIDLKLNNGVDKLENEKLNIESHIKTIRESHLISNLLDTDNIDDFLNFPLADNLDKYTEITNDLYFPIIRFLIRNEMIDGNYQDYLTYFYDSELKIQDQTFIRSVFDEKPLSSTHKLTNTQAVLEVLESVSDNNPAFINYDLFSYIFNHGKKDTDKYINLLKRYKNCELIIEYLRKGKQISLLIKTLNSLWDSFYIDVDIATKWSHEDQTRFLQMELTHEESEVLKIVNNKNNLRADIETNIDLFIVVSDEDQAKIIKNLLEIEAKLHDVSSLTTSDRFRIDIYKNKLYKITIPNIQFWLRNVYKYQEPVEANALLSAVFSKPTETLSIYTSKHLDELVGDIISNYPNVEFNDIESNIFQILNSTTTNLETKKLYTNRLIPQVEDVSKINDIDVIKLLLEKNRVKFTINNLLALFADFGNSFSEEYSMYLTKHEKEWVIDEPINSTLYSKEFITEFFNKALSDPSLNKLVTETLLAATKKEITNQITTVDEEKAKALISSQALVMNENNLAYIRTHHPKLVLEFEKTNLKSFRAILDSEMNIDPLEIVNLLESGIDGQEQYNLIRRVKINIPYKASYQFPGVKKHIITSLLDTNDIEKVIIDPDTKSNKNLFPATLTVIMNNIDFIVQKGLTLPYAFFKELKNRNLISQNNLLEVFANSLGSYSPVTIKENILALHISPFDEMFNGKHPRFISNAVNLKILSVLEKKHMAKKARNEKLYPKKIKI